MNREETLALYEQGVEAWNKWANEMLEERKRLEEAGEWKIDADGKTSNKKTKDFLSKAEANFSTEKYPHTFDELAIFSNLIFPNTALFEKAIFKKYAYFKNSEFHGLTYFNRAIFYNTTSYEEANFFKKISFDNTIFKEGTSFEASNFFDDSSFYETKFEHLISFNSVSFNQEVSFMQGNFLKSAFFIETKFHGQTNFSSASFNITHFHDAHFKGLVIFSGAEFNKFASFCNNTFEEEVDFSAIQADNAFTLVGTKFSTELPNFIQANFKEAPRLDNIEFGPKVHPSNFLNSITTHIPRDIKARYQALKRLAVQAHDHENEQRFWAGELRSDRSLRTEDGSWNLRPLVSAFWWGNIAYGCVSDYGRSIVRPIGALLILICLMTTLHLTKSKTPLTYDQAFSAGYISTNKSFLYIGADPTKRSIIKEKYSALYGANENQTPKIPKTILTAEFIQTLLSAIFIFLALLGIRNNFKMK